MESFAQSLLAQITDDQDVIIEFFAVFSRFEYALKRANYIKCGSGVEANWDKFASHLKNSFRQDSSPELDEAVAYLLDNPPKKEVAPRQWKKVSQDVNEPTLTYLLRAIRQIRNNLFHGGKYPGEPVPDPTRNRELLEYALCVLEECLRLDAEPAKKVRSHFEKKLELGGL